MSFIKLLEPVAFMFALGVILGILVDVSSDNARGFRRLFVAFLVVIAALFYATRSEAGEGLRLSECPSIGFCVKAKQSDGTFVVVTGEAVLEFPPATFADEPVRDTIAKQCKLPPASPF